MRRIGAVGMAVAAFLVLSAQGRPKELQDLEVKSLTVTDGRGQACIKLAFSGTSPALIFADGNRKGRLAIALTGDKSDPWAPTLYFRDKDEGGRLNLALSSAGQPHMQFLDGGGTPRLNLLLREDAPIVALCDAKGDVILKMPK
jgi:hypothetical protein